MTKRLRPLSGTFIATVNGELEYINQYEYAPFVISKAIPYHTPTSEPHSHMMFDRLEKTTQFRLGSVGQKLVWVNISFLYVWNQQQCCSRTMKSIQISLICGICILSDFETLMLSIAAKFILIFVFNFVKDLSEGNYIIHVKYESSFCNSSKLGYVKSWKFYTTDRLTDFCPVSIVGNVENNELRQENIRLFHRLPLNIRPFHPRGIKIM